jgi:hypothetical protein
VKLNRRLVPERDAESVWHLVVVVARPLHPGVDGLLPSDSLARDVLQPVERLQHGARVLGEVCVVDALDNLDKLEKEFVKSAARARLVAPEFGDRVQHRGERHQCGRSAKDDQHGRADQRHDQ